MPIKSFSIKAPSGHNFVIGGSHGAGGGRVRYNKHGALQTNAHCQNIFLFVPLGSLMVQLWSLALLEMYSSLNESECIHQPTSR